MKKILSVILIFTILLFATNYSEIMSNDNTTVEINGKSPGTVVSSQSGIIYYTSNGEIQHTLSKYDHAWDVDKLSNSTVMTVVSNRTDLCRSCSKNYIIKWNITTGNTEVVYSENSYRTHNLLKAVFNPTVNKWHDVDRIAKNRYIIADIARDSVRIVNTTTQTTEWFWSAKSSFSPENTGGNYPYDWTHLNDVDKTEHGYMVSLRNHDQVIFLTENGTVRETLTLGSDNKYSVLYEQHNPDFIDQTKDRILVADSENNQVIEYYRENESWKKAWVYKGTTWVRDADRLSNGNTLITSTRDNKVVEVTESKKEVWEMTGVPSGYDSLRLNGSTPIKESTGPGYDTKLEVTPNNYDNDTSQTILGILRVVTPIWFGFIDGFILILGFVCLGVVYNV